MAKKPFNKCVHLTAKQHDLLVRASELTDRSISQILRDCISVGLERAGGSEEQLAEERLDCAHELVTDSIHSMPSMDFLNPERSEGFEDDTQHTRFSRLMDSAQRPEVLHG